MAEASLTGGRAAAVAPVRGPVVIASRCAWTLYNFRRGLISAIAKRGDGVVALGAELEGYGRRLSDEGVDFRAVPVSLRGLAPLEDLHLFWRFYRTFLQLRPRVAHFFTIKPVIFGVLAAAAAGVPRRVCTITGLGHAFTEGGPLLRWAAESLYRAALSFAHVVFFQNEEDRALFVARGLVDPAKAHVVAGSGVDLERFAPARLREGLPDRPIRFLMLSRLLREKGVMEFVAAATQVRRAGAAAEFRLIGGQDTRNPTALSEHELGLLQASPVAWEGPVDDVRQEIADADVVVLPSYREGTPRALLEAMAMGRAVISTDAPGCRDVVTPGVTGERVPPRDGHALAEAMLSFVADAERLASFGRAGRAFVETRYDERAVIARTLQAYQPIGS